MSFRRAALAASMVLVGASALWLYDRSTQVVKETIEEECGLGGYRRATLAEIINLRAPFKERYRNAKSDEQKASIEAEWHSAILQTPRCHEPDYSSFNGKGTVKELDLSSPSPKLTVKTSEGIVISASFAKNKFYSKKSYYEVFPFENARRLKVGDMVIVNGRVVLDATSNKISTPIDNELTVMITGIWLTNAN